MVLSAQKLRDIQYRELPLEFAILDCPYACGYNFFGMFDGVSAK